ncbi:hypothetical protein WT94_19385 [Burkholderia stagnalis]|nr:hypothetical protein WT76_29535 [Burkholderia stagnalis]KWO22505.1 hypothetical protein WT94_19385 [Burkholderia stagnalis]
MQLLLKQIKYVLVGTQIIKPLIWSIKIIFLQPCPMRSYFDSNSALRSLLHLRFQFEVVDFLQKCLLHPRLFYIKNRSKRPIPDIQGEHVIGPLCLLRLNINLFLPRQSVRAAIEDRLSVLPDIVN